MENIIVVPGLLSKCFRMKQVSVPRSTETEKAKNLLLASDEEVEGDDHSKSEEHLANKQATVLPSEMKE